MKNKRAKFWWTKPWLYGFWVVLTGFALLLVAKLGTQFLPPSQAAEVDTSGGIGFDAYLCSGIGYIHGLIIALAVLTVIIAGVTYMTSEGNKEGISTAKSMITAAITGILLFAFGQFLLGSCGTGAGGFITRFFSGNLPT